MEGMVATDDVMGGKPRLEGRRVSIRQAAELVIDGGLTPTDVADQRSLSLADVYHALAYFYDHPNEMEAVRDDREEVYERAKQRAETARLPEPTRQKEWRRRGSSLGPTTEDIRDRRTVHGS